MRVKPGEMKVGKWYYVVPPEFIVDRGYRLPMFKDEDPPGVNNGMHTRIWPGQLIFIAKVKTETLHTEGVDRTPVLVSHDDVVGWIYPDAAYPNFELAQAE